MTGRPAEAGISDPIKTMLTGSMFTHVGYALAVLGVADALGDRTLHVKQVADTVEAHPDALLQLMRTGTGLGLFIEAPPRFFALTEAGQRMRKDTPESRYSSFIRSVERNGPLLAEIMHTLRTGRPAWEKVHGGGIFNQPDDAYKLQLHDSPQLKAILAGYDMSEVRTVVDVAGGHGNLISYLLKQHPRLRGVLFEQPPAIRLAKETMAADLAARCRFVEGSFFDTVPEGGDLYLITRALHNWNDDDVVRILSTIGTAMPPTARLLVAERLVDGGDPDAMNLFLNMLMMLLNGGRERGEEEYRDLMEQAGFTVTGVRHPEPRPGVPSESVLEASLK
nr:O-methyltransferase [uncultured bacterium]